MAELTKAEKLVTVYQVLVELAQRGDTITYEEMAAAIQVSNARLVGRYLDPIAVHLLMAGLPPLTALVVSKVNGKPGAGLMKTPQSFEDGRAWVYAYPWDPELFAPLLA